MFSRLDFLKLLWQSPVLIFLPFLSGPSRDVPPPQPEWEYTIELVNPLLKGGLPNILSKRGSEGWELCTRTPRTSDLEELIFKRRILTG